MLTFNDPKQDSKERLEYIINAIPDADWIRPSTNLAQFVKNFLDKLSDNDIPVCYVYSDGLGAIILEWSADEHWDISIDFSEDNGIVSLCHACNIRSKEELCTRIDTDKPLHEHLEAFMEFWKQVNLKGNNE